MTETQQRQHPRSLSQEGKEEELPLQDPLQEFLADLPNMPNKIAKLLGHAWKPSSSSPSSSKQSKSGRAVVPEPQAQPLTGAALYILDYEDLLLKSTTTSSSSSLNNSGLADYEEVVQVIQALGGRVVEDLDRATHAIMVQGEQSSTTAENPYQEDRLDNNGVMILNPRLEHDIVAAQALSIPIVQATPWLQRCAGLTTAKIVTTTTSTATTSSTTGDTNGSSVMEHWSAVPVLDIIPTVVLRFNEQQQQQQQQRQQHRSQHQHHHRRRDTQDSLSQSLSQTFHSLTREDPDLMERDALRRAMELSLLDCAIVVREEDGKVGGVGADRFSAATTKTTETTTTTTTIAHHRQVLGIAANATSSQIKAAYRKMAKQTHPDRGGSQEDFHRVALAYRALLTQQTRQQSFDSLEPSGSRESYGSGGSLTNNSNSNNKTKHLKSTAHWDNELADHRRLVEELFAGHGANITESVNTLSSVMSELLYLEARNAGSINVNEKQQTIHNSCFYLSLAASYLSGIGALDTDVDPTLMAYTNESQGIASAFGEEERYLIGETALQLKRLIEAAVVSAHPEWAASGMVGEEVQGFSDFLVYLLDSPATRISHWSIVVFDATSGVCDVFKGKYYDEEDDQQQRCNCITLQYIP